MHQQVSYGHLFVYFRMPYIGQSEASKTFERKGLSYRGFNFKGTNILGYGNWLFRYLVLSNLISFNDNMELLIDIMQNINNSLWKDMDNNGSIIKEFFRTLFPIRKNVLMTTL